MKALSIIGILTSLLGVIFGVSAATYSGTQHDNSDLHLCGVIMLFVSLYFLVFSIVAMVASKKKKADPSQN